MKKILVALALFICLYSSSAHCALENNLTGRFKFWLLNNEARAFSSLSFDREIIARVETAFSIIAKHPDQSIKAAETIWEKNRSFYVLLDEIEHVYSVARRYGNGRFAIILQQARPEIYSTVPFHQLIPGVFTNLQSVYRKAFFSALIKALSLDPDQDVNLSARLNKALRKLSDQDLRLFNSYLDNFSALFPGDNSARMIKAFIQTGSREEFGQGVSKFLRPEFIELESLPLSDGKNAEKIADPLAELEKLVSMSDSSSELDIRVSQPAQDNAPATAEDYPEPENVAPPKETIPENKPLEEPEPGVEEMFNIWD
jgi:hypothetical protein